MDKQGVGGGDRVMIRKSYLMLSFLSLNCRSASLTCPCFPSPHFVTSITTDPYFQQGWFHFQESLYYIPSEKNTWQLSREDCLQNGSDLTVINSREEQVGDGVWIWGEGGGQSQSQLSHDGFSPPSRFFWRISRWPYG